MTRNKFVLLGSALVATVAAAPFAARATPYAYASNQITGLTVTFAGGGSVMPTTATTSISDSAQFNGYNISGFQANGVVGNGLTISQAYSGPGPAPGATYTPQGPGSFTGARSNASIGAGSASAGGVSVSNVAEAYGNALGNSVGTNNAAISFQVTGTGQALTVSFSDLVQLTASTAALTGETANAAIQNNFSITPQGSSTPFATFSPGDLNRQIASAAGAPPTNNVGPTSYFETFTSAPLTSGVIYNIALTSTASETIQPGRTTPTPEPASLALMGAGLAALGFVPSPQGNLRQSLSAGMDGAVRRRPSPPWASRHQWL